MRVERRYLFYSVRIVFLLSSILFSLAWIVMGFDSTVDTMFNDNPAIKGVGFHWSTLNGLMFLAYFSMVNLQCGGFRNLGHVWFELKTDLKCLFLGGRSKRRELHANKFRASDFSVAFLFSGALATFALFAFEYPYVFMLNWFHFDSLLFPVYTYNTDGRLINPTHFRNLLGLVGPFFILMVFTKLSGFARLRPDRYFIILIIATSIIWLGWIAYPSDLPIKTYDDFILQPDDIYLSNQSTLYQFNSSGWTWPNQKFFPQTIYIIINATRENPYHFREDLDGWWQDDPPVHALNVLTKYMVFLSIGYLFMVKVEK